MHPLEQAITDRNRAYLRVNSIPAIIEDIRGIVKILDPQGYAWAQEEKERRERRKEKT